MKTVKKEKFFRFEDIILYQDDDLVVVNKPRNVASLDDKGERNIHQMALSFRPDLKLCHRLDKLTSGVLLLTKGEENYRNIALQFQHRKVHKHYHTLVHGIHRFEAHMINLPLLVGSNKRVTVNKQSGKRSETIVNTARHFKNYSLLNCEPITGRMHQIRAHLAAEGCPIVGDELYGGRDIMLSQLKRNYKPSGRREEQALNHGFLLHAFQLEFAHPVSGETMTFEAPYPKNFGVVLKMLEKYNSLG